VNRIFLKPLKYDAFGDKSEEVTAAWFDGRKFRTYPDHDEVSIGDTFRMKIAGFTHVQIVWWSGERVMWIKVEL
jgi:hypothetical protein